MNSRAIADAPTRGNARNGAGRAGSGARVRDTHTEGDRGPVGARGPKVDVDRSAAPVLAISEDLAPFASEWHAHQRHQILYSAQGTLRFQVSDKQWLLPPQRGAFIRANVQHRASAEQRVLLRTLYLDPSVMPPLAILQANECVVFPVSPLVRELILHGMRWDGEHADPSGFGVRLFGVCAELCAENAAMPLVLWLPTGQTPEIQHAIVHTLAHLGDDLRQADVARAAGLSERSLARRFPEETQMTWLRFLQSARLLRATELLSAPGARVTSTAFTVGFDSLAAFTRAFERFTGEAPKDYRKRIKASQGAGTRGDRA